MRTAIPGAALRRDQHLCVTLYDACLDTMGSVDGDDPRLLPPLQVALGMHIVGLKGLASGQPGDRQKDQDPTLGARGAEGTFPHSSPNSL